jgi:hypothetical protein
VTTQPQEEPWHFASIRSDGAESAGRLEITEEVPTDLYEATRAALLLLHQMSDLSEFAVVENSYKTLVATVQGSLQPPFNADTARIRQHRYMLESSLDALLRALRAMADRTAHSMSGRYGKDSEQHQAFKAACAFEYDNTFAYRFMYKLRNYSQHAASPFQIMRLSSGAPFGEGRAVLALEFDPTQLLADSKDWGARVKEDLQKMPGPIPVMLICEQLDASVKRIFLKTLLAQDLEITQATETVRQTAQLVPGGPEGACFALLHGGDKAMEAMQADPATGFTASFQAIDVSLANHVEHLLNVARHAQSSAQL